jgi:hypothetical protein
MGVMNNSEQIFGSAHGNEWNSQGHHMNEETNALLRSAFSNISKELELIFKEPEYVPKIIFLSTLTVREVEINTI